MKTQKTHYQPACDRAGSTLIIVIALLGLLSFVGVVFFTFAAQEKASAEYFSEAQKFEIPAETDNVLPFGLRQLIVGPNAEETDSILFSPTQRFSMISNAFGSDLSPFNGGAGVRIEYDGSLVPQHSGTFTTPANQGTVLDFLEVVDSPMAWGLDQLSDPNGARTQLANLFDIRGTQGIVPAPDVDYTAPDINSMFLAYRGTALRINQDGSQELVPVTIPTFFRPSMVRVDDPLAPFTPTNPNWATDDPTNQTFAQRSFRPHPSHIVRNLTTGDADFRYFADGADATAAGLVSGPFLFLPENSTNTNNDNAVQGELGIWTGSFPTVMELDVDNDRFAEVDGTTSQEGIWLDLGYPVQEITVGGVVRKYTVLHSFTVYDLDSLINVNIHGNLAGLPRDGTMLDDGTMPGVVTNNVLRQSSVSQSNLALSPAEINPTYVLRRLDQAITNMPTAVSDHFGEHYGRTGTSLTAVEQANMELIWLLTGRAEFSATGIDDIIPGRWGDIQALLQALTAAPVDGGGSLSRYPRPGRSDQLDQIVSVDGGVRFGGDLTTEGTRGFDDNGDRFEGEALIPAGIRRPFGRPIDFAGTGRYTQQQLSGFDVATGQATGAAGNPLARLTNSTSSPAAWPSFDGYSVVREPSLMPGDSNVFNFAPRYLFGPDQMPGGGDDLISNPFFDPLFEDPMETAVDIDNPRRPSDNIFSAEEMFRLHLNGADYVQADDLSRLSDLAPWAFDEASNRREMVTTVSNTLRHIPFPHPFGIDGRPGIGGLDDDGDGQIDELDEVFASTVTNADPTDDELESDSRWRAWEWSADQDQDRNLEFPPRFGPVLPYSVTRSASSFPQTIADPFRSAFRRMITVEAGEPTQIFGHLAASVNQLVDVPLQFDQGTNTSSIPVEGTIQFLRYIQQVGLTFRTLTEHALADEDNAATEGNIITLDHSTDEGENDDGDDVYFDASAVPFPPTNVREREFWARRDRQQLARDFYVLLYTLGGAELDGNGFPLDYTGINDPNAVDAASGRLYSHAQLRQMAQMAVNMVDALDPDDVITKFEYDKNLGDGWNLDDDAFSDDGYTVIAEGASEFANVTENGRYREDSGSPTFDRGVVYGVEAQQLTFNEVFAVRTPELMADHPATFHDDTNGPSDVLHFELQNVLPTPVNLGEFSNTAQQGIWRVIRRDREPDAGAPNEEPIRDPNDFERAIVVLSNAKTDSVVPGGDRLIIATAGPMYQGPGGVDMPISDFYIDVDNTMNYTVAEDFERISPDIDNANSSVTTTTGLTRTVAASSPLIAVDIDTQVDTESGTHFAITDDSSPTELAKGAFLEDVDSVGDPLVETYGGNRAFNRRLPPGLSTNRFASTGDLGFELILQRRANPNLPALDADENPWIEVDRVVVEFEEMPLDEPTTPVTVGEIQTRLTNLGSNERQQPLVSLESKFSTAAQPDFRHNTIGQANESLATPWNLHQNHPDRDFASIGDLFSIPIIGPELLTQRLIWSRRGPEDQGHTFARDGVINGLEVMPDLTAAESLQLVDDETNLVPPTADVLIPELLTTADSKFLRPNFPDGQTNGNSFRDNRWYRALTFWEVPSRVNRMLGDPRFETRVPGKLNPNTIRHKEVFAGLLDDATIADPRDDPSLINSPPVAALNSFPDGPFMSSVVDPGDRYAQFLLSRDGQIPTLDPEQTGAASNVTMVVPGLPFQANMPGPFRPLTSDRNLNPNGNGISHTLLRAAHGISNQTAVALPNRAERQWLEIGNDATHNATAANGMTVGTTATSAERLQLLSKIMNHTTTTSNTFIVFATAGFFECVEDPTTGLVRIGGEFDLNDDGVVGETGGDRQRAAYIIDRTEALNAFDPGTGDFDFTRLIKAEISLD